jgi:hypothetical protein
LTTGQSTFSQLQRLEERFGDHSLTGAGRIPASVRTAHGLLHQCGKNESKFMNPQRFLHLRLRALAIVPRQTGSTVVETAGDEISYANRRTPLQ